MGKVYLVGAGPGNAMLLTLRAKMLLEKADVVVYDRLVNRSILSLAPHDAVFIDVGKEKGHHPIPQHRIHMRLIEASKRADIVVRLKGGDPYLFGRGGEEAAALKREGIAFEVVPGVPSAFAVLNYAGIPATHRDCAANLQIISAHRRQEICDAIDYQRLAQASGTMIFFMGVSALPMICEELIKAGLSSDTDAAIIENGTTALQRSVVGTLTTLPQKADEAKIQSPALIVVGNVVQFSEMLAWAKENPLHGTRVIVTRAQSQASRLSQMLLDKGAEVIEASAIHIHMDADQDAMKYIQQINTYDYVAFTSENGVEAFMELLRKHRLDIRSLNMGKAAAIGKGTARALEKYALYPDVMPDTYDAKALGQAIAKTLPKGGRVLALRARETSPDLQCTLREAGIIMDDVSIYRTEQTMSNVQWVREWMEQSPVYVMLGSASCARSFARSLGKEALSRVYAICIGEATHQEAEREGYPSRFVSKEASLESMVERLEEAVKEHREKEENNGFRK